MFTKEGRDMNVWQVVGATLVAMGSSVAVILVAEKLDVGERLYDLMCNLTNRTWCAMMRHTGLPEYTNPYQPRRYRA
jgi:hypothetical protein